MRLLCPIDVCDCEKGFVEESFRTESECRAYLNCWATIPINERPFCQSVLNLGWVIRYHEEPQAPKPEWDDGLIYGLTVCLLEKAFEDSKEVWNWRDLGPDDLNCHFQPQSCFSERLTDDGIEYSGWETQISEKFFFQHLLRTVTVKY